MYYLRLTRQYLIASLQNELAYRANFWISLLHSLLNLGSGILGIYVLFGKVETIRGWDYPSILGVLGIYLIFGSLKRLFIGPSLESLAGVDGEVWSGNLDFTLLRPIDIQFQASARYWQPLAVIDLFIGLGVLGISMVLLGQRITLVGMSSFLLTLFLGFSTLYAVLLTFAGLVFWSPGFLFTWIFDSLFQMARYPVGVYPGWLRLILTWVVPVGIMTTIPAQALTGELTHQTLIAGLLMGTLFLAGGSLLFRSGIRHYVSASS
jgi:ABC-2 type transport system permease protein